MANGNDTPLQFPCRFPIKAVGAAEEDFADHVKQLIERHTDPLPEEAIQSRASRQGSFISITVTIEATSRAQLDAIYGELSASKRIKFAL